MKHLHKFDTKAAHNAAYSRDNGEYIEPWVAYTEETDSVSYNLPHDYSKDYLTFKALEDGTFSFSKSGLSYSLDNGQTWNELAANTATPFVQKDKTISFKGEITQSSKPQNHGYFSSTCRFNSFGNPYSLVYGDNFSSIIDISEKSRAIASIFRYCSNLISAKELILQATTLSDYCYAYMFEGCTSLTDAPQLPATTLAEHCYNGMFYGCTSLIIAPELPAMALINDCYYQMFHGCTALTAASELPATTLAQSCYCGMFNGCTSLTTAPELPATTLANNCYQQMFNGCTSLTAAPELPATTLVNSCYSNMFVSCTHLNYIKMLATDISASGCLSAWVLNVASSGTFVKNSTATWNVTGNNGIPTGWTVQTASA